MQKSGFRNVEGVHQRDMLRLNDRFDCGAFQRIRGEIWIKAILALTGNYGRYCSIGVPGCGNPASQFILGGSNG